MPIHHPDAACTPCIATWNKGQASAIDLALSFSNNFRGREETRRFVAPSTKFLVILIVDTTLHSPQTPTKRTRGTRLALPTESLDSRPHFLFLKGIMYVFSMVGREDNPLFELVQIPSSVQESERDLQFVLHASLDVVDAAKWSTTAMHLRAVDAYKALTVRCAVFIFFYFFLFFFIKKFFSATPFFFKKK